MSDGCEGTFALLLQMIPKLPWCKENVGGYYKPCYAPKKHINAVTTAPWTSGGCSGVRKFLEVGVMVPW